MVTKSGEYQPSSDLMREFPYHFRLHLRCRRTGSWANPFHSTRSPPEGPAFLPEFSNVTTISPDQSTAAPHRSAELLARLRDVRAFSTVLCETLEGDDFGVQSMPDCSPVKWHLAHTTWFFETFVLAVARPDEPPFDARFGFLFNSYYDGVGARHPRPRRGLLTRPTVAEVFEYRARVDERMVEVLDGDGLSARLLDVVEVGLQHEQQHQELLLTDVKHLFSCNPLEPALRPGTGFATTSGEPRPAEWTEFDGGVHSIGHAGAGFAFDNESPRHAVYLEPFRLANRLVTNGEYLAFVEDDGYRRPEFWLSDGWATVQAEGWTSPIYWHRDEAGRWSEFTVAGRVPLDSGTPVSHLSGYEADAFARWSSARLPTEAEWEVAAASLSFDEATRTGNLADSQVWHPRPLPGGPGGVGLAQMFGDVWEWTASPYVAYPGFRPLAGTLGEYNGKFMCNQLVLRGGSCGTSRSHIRATYRNFFPPGARWQFTGLRLARDPSSP
jgi:ergothioneine biosynthesis protein EgtB